MDLLQLHYFQTVARLEHVTRAAEELRVAQPALSKTIARLETELGVPLFDRRGRRVALNTCGRAFLRHVERLFMALEDGRQELADLASLTRGTVTVAPDFDTNRYILTDVRGRGSLNCKALWISCLDTWPKILDTSMAKIDLQCLQLLLYFCV